MKKVQILVVIAFLAIAPGFLSCKSKEKEKAKEEQKTTVDKPVTVDSTAPTITTSPDDALIKGLRDALKDHPSVRYSVIDGKIVLSGEIAKDKWMAIKQNLDKLMSKGYDLTGLTIK